MWVFWIMPIEFQYRLLLDFWVSGFFWLCYSNFIKLTNYVEKIYLIYNERYNLVHVVFLMFYHPDSIVRLTKFFFCIVFFKSWVKLIEIQVSQSKWGTNRAQKNEAWLKIFHIWNILIVYINDIQINSKKYY